MYKRLISVELCGYPNIITLSPLLMRLSDVQNAVVAPRDCIAGIQSLLLTVMSNIVRHLLSKRDSDSQIADEIEEEQKSCFVDAAIGFCKLQHLDSTISTKCQVSHGFFGESLLSVMTLKAILVCFFVILDFLKFVSFRLS